MLNSSVPIRNSSTPTDEGAISFTVKESGAWPPYPFAVKRIKMKDAIELAYIDEGDSKNTAVILFLHGVGSSIPVWEKNVCILKNSYRCIALDLPGHGYSSKQYFSYTMQFYAMVVIEFIKELGLPSVNLVGHSMGGQIAIHISLLEPRLVSHLILVSPSGVEPYRPFEKQLLINCMSAIVTFGNAFTHNHLTYLIGFNYNVELANSLISKLPFFKNEATVFATIILRSVQGMLLESVNTVLSKITQKTLVLIGTQDMVSPYNYMRTVSYADVAFEMAKKIPNVIIRSSSTGGHFMSYQQPELFNEEILHFLSEH